MHRSQWKSVPFFAALLFGAFLAVRPAAAQDPADDPTPLIEDLEFEGLEAIKETELETTLHTDETRCRIFLLEPLCAITKNHLFEARRYLDREELKRDVLRIRVFYWLRGFRHARVDTTVVSSGRGVDVTFKITEGPPTLIDTVAVTQTRDPVSLADLRRWGLPSKGDRIDMTRLDSLRSHVRRKLWDEGRGNAEVHDTVRVIDTLSVALNVTIDPGPVTRVDTVLVEGNEKVSDRTVRRLVAMREGDLYRRAELLEAQRRLFRSDLFRQMMLTSPDSADSLKTIVVEVREAPMRSIQAGGGFNTVEFGQLLGNLTLYNFKGTARRVELRSAVGNLFAQQFYGKRFFGSAAPLGVGGEIDDAFLQPTWQASASMTQPWFFSTKNSIGVSVFSNRRSVPGIVIDRGTGGSATFTRTIKNNAPLSLTYRYERSRVDAGELYFCAGFGYCRDPIINALRTPNSLSPLVITLNADRTDDPLMPTTGYTARFDAEHASAITVSDWRYHRIEADVTPYLKMGNRTLVVRAHAGWVKALESTLTSLGLGDSGAGILLHPRVRFYGGGARSVRGYAEGQLGPRVLTIDPSKLTTDADTSRGAACTLASLADASCDPNVASSSEFVPRPVGGNTLLEGTLEYRIALTPNLGGAVFVDAGRIGASEAQARVNSRTAITPGVGFRYLSPIGPVRLDLGWRPKRTEDLPVITQIREEDGTLRLVELNTMKRYDETEGHGGFLGAIASRLQLHLYIGEAY